MKGGGGHVVNVLSEELRPTAPRIGFADDDALDTSLANAAQAGDLNAFATLYDRHHDRLLRFCRSRLGNADDAADAAQETFLRAWRALDTFGSRGSVYPWLHAIARNVCTDALRKRLRVDISDDRVLGTLPDTGMSALDRLDAEADAAMLRAALDRLSARHREILSLREYEGWSYERIADAEQLELNAVKSLVWRARQALRREFLLLNADGGRFGGFLGLGLLLRRALPTARRALDRVAFAAGELTAAGNAAAATASATAANVVSTASVAAVSAASVAAVAIGASVAAPPPPAPAAIVVAAPAMPATTGDAPDGEPASEGSADADPSMPITTDAVSTTPTTVVDATATASAPTTAVITPSPASPSRSNTTSRGDAPALRPDPRSSGAAPGPTTSSEPKAGRSASGAKDRSTTETSVTTVPEGELPTSKGSGKADGKHHAKADATSEVKVDGKAPDADPGNGTGAGHGGKGAGNDNHGAGKKK